MHRGVVRASGADQVTGRGRRGAGHGRSRRAAGRLRAGLFPRVGFVARTRREPQRRERRETHCECLPLTVLHPRVRPLRIRGVQEPCHLYVVDDVPEIEPDAPLVLVSSQSTPTATDSDCWPEVIAVPSGPVAAASAVFADRLLRRAVAALPMHVAYPDGTVIGAGDASSPTLTANDPDRLARRMGRHGLVGFGESYMAGEWKSTDLGAGLTILAPALNPLVPRGLRWLKPLGIAAQPDVPRFSREQTQRNTAAHYDDVSSDLFIEFLDETMTYSSAAVLRCICS